MNNEIIERWYSMNEICEHLGITRDTALSWIEKRGMPGVKIGRTWNFKISEIDNWMRSSKKSSYNVTFFKLGELFCGPGGIAYGALKAKSADGRFAIKHAWANDFDADTCETYRNNICPKSPNTVYCCDVRDLDIKKLGPKDDYSRLFICRSTIPQELIMN